MIILKTIIPTRLWSQDTLNLYCARRKRKRNSRKRDLEHGAIKKYRVAEGRQAEGIETLRFDIAAGNSAWSILLQSLLYPIERDRYIFLGSQDKCCPRGGTKRCFHKAALFFLRPRPRIQFFLPLWCLRFFRFSVLPFLSPRLSFGYHFAFERPLWCDGGFSGLVFHEFILLLQELIFFLLPNWCTSV